MTGIAIEVHFGAIYERSDGIAKLYIGGNVVLFDEHFVLPSHHILVGSGGYAIYHKWCSVDGKPKTNNSFSLHRLVIGAGRGQVVDHINRNRLDNRLVNLRFATHSQNSTNIKVRGWTRHSCGKFQSTIIINGKQEYLGLFDSPQAASDAYRARNATRGAFAAEVAP